MKNREQPMVPEERNTLQQEGRSQAHRPADALPNKAYQRLDGSWENELGESIRPPDTAKSQGTFIRTGIRQRKDGSYVDQFGNPTQPSESELAFVRKSEIKE